MSEKQKFSTREWLFVISILVLLQFIVHWLSSKFSGSQSALGYVSFAGTLVSIMLGLIAIIYSFVQSISQSNSVVEIRDQVDKLIAAGKEITDSGKIIHTASAGINHLMEDLVAKVAENTTAAKEVLGGFSSLTSSLDLYSGFESAGGSKSTMVVEAVGRDEGSTLQNEEIALLDTNRIIMAISFLSLYEFSKRGYTFRVGEDKFLGKLSKHTGMNKEFLAGSISAALLSLEAIGCVDLPDKDVYQADLSFSENFIAAMKQLIPETMDGENEQFTGYWLAVNEKDIPEAEG